MKKIIYLTLLVLIVACYNNSDELPNNPIVGSWQLTPLSDSNGNPTQDACDLESYMTLSTTNSGNYYSYNTNNPDNEPCELESVFNITWSEVSSSNYSLSVVEAGAGQNNITLSAVLEGDTLTMDTPEGPHIYTRN